MAARIVMHRRAPEAYSLAENVWLAGMEMRLRERAAAQGAAFELRWLSEDDEFVDEAAQ